MLEGFSYLQNVPNRDQITSMLDEMDRAFRIGKPYYRQYARFMEECALALGVPLCNWYAQVLALVGSGGLPLWPRIQMHPRDAMMLWLTRKARGQSATSNWFRPTDALVHSLLATDLTGAVAADIVLPYDAFYIELPPDILYALDRATGFHEVRTVIVAMGKIDGSLAELARRYRDPKVGNRLVIAMVGRPNENSVSIVDDTYTYNSYYIGDPMAPLSEVLEMNQHLERELSQLGGRVGNVEVNGFEFREISIRLVMNLCIYIAEHGFRSAHEEEIKRLESGPFQKRKTTKQRIRLLKADRLFEIGSDVVIDPELREHVRTTGSRAPSKLSYRVLVRGHWRNQACGPKRSERRRQWIKPHIRGADLPTPVVGHSYDVK